MRVYVYTYIHYTKTGQVVLLVFQYRICSLDALPASRIYLRDEYLKFQVNRSIRF